MLHNILGHNWFLVFFVYGLAFFLMGFSIAFHVKRPSTFRLARYLWLLAGFGLLHGLAEWAYIFYPPSLDVGSWETLSGAVLNSSHAMLVAFSFVFLFAFGGSLLSSTLGWRQWLRWLPVIILPVWGWVFLFNPPRGSQQQLDQWLGFAEIASRYLLALPGAVLTGIALYLQRGEIRGLQNPPLERVLLWAAGAFTFYAFAGGLVVPYASFFPANFVNTHAFLNIGLPIQLLRTVAGILMAYFVIRSLDLFEIESRSRLEALHQRELIWLEKERIRRDLHDGLIQSIYALSLGLNHALSLMKNDLPACADRMRDLVRRADTIIAQLRQYLQEMKACPGLSENAVIIIEDLLAEFSASTGLIPEFYCRGSQERDMEPVQRGHLYHMGSEILSNIRRHAGAGKVKVNLDLGTKGLRLAVRDDGVGFIPANFSAWGMGMVNLRERAALAGGWVDIKSGERKGTEVFLWLPYNASTKEGEL